MKKLTDVKPNFRDEESWKEFWWELNLKGCGVDTMCSEIVSKVYSTRKARDNNWVKFAKLNGFKETI